MSSFDDAFHHIAIIGRFGRFPGAPDLATYWQNLRAGVESISFFTDEELLAAGTPPEALAAPNFVGAKSTLEDADRFDAGLFGYSPSEAELMDPQHRLFLEAAWSALEDAGYDPARAEERIGVFAGVAANTYLRNLYSSPEVLEGVSDLQIIVGNDKDFLASKVSYKLDLRGPSVVVQTACSTSLVALHLACQSLINQESTLALAGGVSVKVPLVSGYPYLEGGHRSPDGHCRAFDAEANGTAFGDGVGVVVLKRLSEAMADGDTIHAVIRGTAINNDGSLKAGYTAPSEAGQAEVLAEALALAEIEPETVGMIEAHGTGTTLGDPIEVAALKRVYGSAPRPERCALGSVKTNVGHLDAAAGVAGLLKAVSSLEHGEIPPSLHFHRPNPRLELEESPFFVPTEPTPWPVDGPRRAGISSFGVGGTNAHVVLEEAPRRLPSGPSRRWQIAAFSARGDGGLEQLAESLAKHLESHPEQPLADVAFTLQMGRRGLPRRRVVVARDREEMARQLAAGEGFTATAARDDRPVAFLFPGQGTQHLRMGMELYRTEREFRRVVDRCSELLEPHLLLDLRKLLDPPAGEEDAAAERLGTTALAQPALFVISYALAQLWISWGVEPRAMLGHSLGEWVAACLAGVVTLEQALPLVAARGALMQSRPAGAMLAVPLAASKIEPRLGNALALAAVNAAERCVVSGPVSAVEDLARRLEEEGVGCRRLATSHAFHSAMMDPILGSFAQRLREIELQAPQIPFVSNVTGTWITPQQATDPDYWCRQLRQTVRFADGLEELLDGDPLLLEVGPGQTLSSLARRAGATAVASLGKASEVPEERRVMAALGALWAQGAAIPWQRLYSGEQRHRVPLPTYPFERQRFWVEGRRSPQAPARRRRGLYRRPEDDWLSVPTWHELAPSSPRPATAEEHSGDEGGSWCLIPDQGGWAKALAEALERRGEEVSILSGAEAEAEDEPWAQRLEDLSVARVVDLRGMDSWAQASEGASEQTSEDAARVHELTALAVAVADAGTAQAPAELTLVARGLASVAGEGPVEPAKALLTGVVAVLPQEEASLVCRGLDLTGAPEEPAAPAMVETLARELLAEEPAETPADAATGLRWRWVALRGDRRFARRLSPWALATDDGPRDDGSWLREEGAYLITGGLGGLGWTLARRLAEERRARLVLIGRSPFPARETWDEILADAHHNTPPDIRQRIAEIRSLEAAGARILVRSADVTDAGAMAQVFARAEEELGPLDGVFHAAGVPGGGIARRRSAEEMAVVLAPKVAGTRVLDQLLSSRPETFLVLFSSVNAVLGGVGQVDYAAANAYLDAFAEARRGEGRRALAIDWDAWREVGMAAAGTRLDPRRHPFLQRIESSDGTLTAHSELQAGQTWVADEHRILGRAVVPGTGQLEIARALFESQEEGGSPANRAVEIHDVFFMAPLVLGESPRQVQARLEPAGDEYRFQLASRPASTGGPVGPDDGPETVHGVARVRGVEAAAGTVDLDALRQRCRSTPPEERLRTWWLGYDGSRDDEEVARYGPRWRSLVSFYTSGPEAGDDESLAELRLDPQVAGDLRLFSFHPGLMDVAVGSLYRARDRGPYAPFSYRRLRIFGAIPEHVVVHARRRGLDEARALGEEADGDAPESLSYDVTVCDPEGRVLVEVEDYTYKRVRMDPMAADEANEEGEQKPKQAARQPTVLQRGLAPEEGLRVLEGLLSHPAPARVVVSTVDLEALEQEIFARMEQLRAPAAARPAHPRPDLATPYVAPRNPSEEQLAEIFQQVLGIERVGMDDSFFELGGDSVIAIQAIARAGQEGFQLSPNDLFQHPTVAQLAERAGSGEAPAATRLPPIEATEGEVLPLSLNQERYWARYRRGGASASLNLPLAVGFVGRLNLPVLAAGLQLILDRHEAMRTRFRQGDDGAQQVVLPRLRLRMPLVDLSRLPEEVSKLEARRLRDHEASHVFDLEREILFRITLIRRSAEEHELFVIKHHLITDGWSGGLFAQELAELYAATVEQREPRLPRLPIRYGDYAVWQREHLVAGGVLAEQLEHWRGELDGGDFPILELPGDHPRQGGGGFPSEDIFRQLPAEPYEALKAFARSHNATPFMVQLAALNVLLAAYTGQRDIALTTDVANRERVETEPLIGLFTNVLVLRNDLAGDPTVEELLERTRNSTVRSFDHQFLPFADLMGALKPGWLEAYHQVFPVAFVFQNYPGRSFSLPGLELRSLEIDPGAVSRDLLVITGETGDGLRVAFRYRTDLFEASTVERLVEDYLGLLRSLPEDPQRRLSDLLAPLSSPAPAR